ncbi:sensor domain-containing diguanylate cyclase [Pelosinus propionicus]|uniref:Diguanylate cyclase (GGDEF) domain-containing protein n=1 Tax=Pelosinus propionicus DSM 13327 TaxID=1123291 RepID=A0A1I4HRP3_9FIRM|nr:sensor domain-containing diguanylate cyclase [Pelosinus propionicus]SFL44026.1 diguanylate cyclase (GGDEF) domain-containing protein [Pelosinus propionicus DSM 13327]
MLSTLLSEDILEKIFFISQRLTNYDGVDDIWEYIAKTALTITRADAVVIRDFNLVSGHLTIVKSYGLSKSYINEPPIRLEEGVIGYVVSESKPYIHSDILQSIEWSTSGLASKEGIRSVVCVPLKGKESSTGAITVMRKKVEPFSEQEIFLLKIFGLQASEAIKIVKLVNSLQQQAMYDDLTQVYNKNALNSVLEKTLSLSKRYSKEMSIIFIDIDNFKMFNDTHGHLLGDKLLCDFAQILKKNCRKSDSVGRFGGEEFVILVPHTNKKKAAAFANKIRRSIEKSTFIGRGNSENSITFSAGISCFPEDGDAIFELLQQADRAMYQSKITGKNKVTSWIDELDIFQVDGRGIIA